MFSLACWPLCPQAPHAKCQSTKENLRCMRCRPHCRSLSTRRISISVVGPNTLCANINSKAVPPITSVPIPRHCHVRISTLADPPRPRPETISQAPNLLLHLRRIRLPTQSGMETQPCDYRHGLHNANRDTDSDRLLHHHRNDDAVARVRDEHAERCRRNRDSKHAERSWRR